MVSQSHLFKYLAEFDLSRTQVERNIRTTFLVFDTSIGIGEEVEVVFAAQSDEIPDDRFTLTLVVTTFREITINIQIE